MTKNPNKSALEITEEMYFVGCERLQSLKVQGRDERYIVKHIFESMMLERPVAVAGDDGEVEEALRFAKQMLGSAYFCVPTEVMKESIDKAMTKIDKVIQNPAASPQIDVELLEALNKAIGIIRQRMGYFKGQAAHTKEAQAHRTGMMKAFDICERELRKMAANEEARK